MMDLYVHTKLTNIIVKLQTKFIKILTISNQLFFGRLFITPAGPVNDLCSNLLILKL